MKRKASALEDSYSATEWPSFDYSSSASTASPESVKAAADSDRVQPHWNIGTVPYFNSRTHKRYRDNRPDEKTIHQNTLTKLFNAQRQVQPEDNGGFRHANYSNATPSMQSHSSSLSNAPVWQAPNVASGVPERNQRSIDSFFGGGSRVTVQPKAARSHPFPFSTIHNTERVVSRCEDCNAILQSTNPTIFVSDEDAMCVDHDLQHDEWTCASCSRHVCDTCAVRGDQRICLECAVPGGG